MEQGGENPPPPGIFFSRHFVGPFPCTTAITGLGGSPTFMRIARCKSFQHIGPLNDLSAKATVTTSSRSLPHQQHVPTPIALNSTLITTSTSNKGLLHAVMPAHRVQQFLLAPR